MVINTLQYDAQYIQDQTRTSNNIFRIWLIFKRYVGKYCLRSTKLNPSGSLAGGIMFKDSVIFTSWRCKELLSLMKGYDKDRGISAGVSVLMTEKKWINRALTKLGKRNWLEMITYVSTESKQNFGPVGNIRTAPFLQFSSQGNTKMRGHLNTVIPSLFPSHQFVIRTY